MRKNATEKSPLTTEQRILSAALELFVRNGFHGTSIDDIMSKVGLTKGAFYSHFEGKDHLFMTLLERYRQHFLGGMEAAIEEHDGDALDKLHHVISYLAKFASEHTYECVFLTFLTTELNTDVDFEPALKRIYLEYQKIISTVVRQGQKQRIFKQGTDPELASLTFMALHDGILHQWMLHRQYVDGAALVRTFREIFIGGLVSSDFVNGLVSHGSATKKSTEKSGPVVVKRQQAARAATGRKRAAVTGQKPD